MKNLNDSEKNEKYGDGFILLCFAVDGQPTVTKACKYAS